MANKKCSRCQNEIDPKAPSCPYCRSDQRIWFVRHPVLSLILGLFILAIISSFGKQPNTKKTELQINNNAATKDTIESTEIIKISAADLYTRYEDNAIKADYDFKNKELEVAGAVGTISKDITDSMYVTLKTGNAVGSIQCMLRNSESEKAMQLIPGESIVVRGKNNGKMINVILRDCLIIAM